ncbi:MAG TPA: threonine dehydratase [Bacteroidetes bacterium]|nr:threonine dehydratase [Bacteroidota bacterium]
MQENKTITPGAATQFDFRAAAGRLEKVAKKTPLILNHNLSGQYGCEVWLKREDLQPVRSYKIRGAYNLMSILPQRQLAAGVVCASAGNHAQGFAFSCRKMKVRGTVFMPVTTPRQKVRQTRMFGKEYVEIKLTGDNFDACSAAAQSFTHNNGMTFIPPFDNARIIEGQGTVGLEIFAELPDPDFVFLPVGGGGLASGVGTCLKNLCPRASIIGVEPEGAPSMSEAIRSGKPVVLPEMDRFIDGAAVKRVGDLTYSICKDILNDVVLAPEGQVCSVILKLYNEEAIVVEPAGALSIAALDQYADKIKGKKVVCVVSGSNNDIDRMPEIKERSLIFEGLKHYYLIRFAQRPGALKEFVNNVLGPTDDITRFEYIKKTKKESGPALVGIEVQRPADNEALKRKMRIYRIDFTEINRDDKLFGYLV